MLSEEEQQAIEDDHYVNAFRLVLLTIPGDKLPRDRNTFWTKVKTFMFIRQYPDFNSRLKTHIQSLKSLLEKKKNEANPDCDEEKKRNLRDNLVKINRSWLFGSTSKNDTKEKIFKKIFDCDKMSDEIKSLQDKIINFKDMLSFIETNEITSLESHVFNDVKNIIDLETALQIEAKARAAREVDLTNAYQGRGRGGKRKSRKQKKLKKSRKNNKKSKKQRK
jgi:hypothetical protein